MNTIKFNNTVFEVESYNKNTYFNEDSISSNGSCQIITNNIIELNELAQETITTIQIYHNETLIYDLQNIECKINSVSEYLNGDRVSIGLSFIFDT